MFGHQIFASNDTVPFKWNSRVGGKGCPIGSSAELAVTKPNLADGSNDLELEAAAKALAANNCRRHVVACWHASLSTVDHVSGLLMCCPGMTSIQPYSIIRIVVDGVDNVTIRMSDCGVSSPLS